MSEQPDPTPRVEEPPGSPFRIGLKWWLLLPIGSGTGIGLLGRLWQRDPQSGLNASVLALAIVPMLLMAGTIVVCALRRGGH